jgi:hypothetical protein
MNVYQLDNKTGFVEKLVKALELNDWRRIVIDIKKDDVALIFVEMLADADRLGEIDLEAGITWERPALDKEDWDEPEE